MSSRSFSGRNGGAWTLQTFAMRYSTKNDRIKNEKQDTKHYTFTHIHQRKGSLQKCMAPKIMKVCRSSA